MCAEMYLSAMGVSNHMHQTKSSPLLVRLAKIGWHTQAATPACEVELKGETETYTLTPMLHNLTQPHTT